MQLSDKKLRSSFLGLDFRVLLCRLQLITYNRQLGGECREEEAGRGRVGRGEKREGKGKGRFGGGWHRRAMPAVFWRMKL
jgi:hypothetical protein